MNERQEYSGHTHRSHSSADASSRHASQSKGRYLKQSSSYGHRRRHHHHRRRVNPMLISAVVLALLLVVLAGIGLRSCGGPSIKGRWDLDGTTVYRFDSNGKGALVLMYGEYEFNYTIEGEKLYIDFIDEGALDASYTFQVQKRMLFLTGGPGDAKSEYVLTRML